MFVGYDNRVDPEDDNNYLAGDENAVYDRAFEWISDNRRSGAHTEAAELCRRAGVDLDDFDDDDQERLIDAIEEGDPSDPIGQLLRNTRDRLLRAPVGLSLGDEPAERDRSDLIYYNDREWEAQQAGRVEMILEMLARSRADTSAPEVRARATELVAEGPQTWHEGVTLDVIWCGDASDVAMTPEQADAGGRQLSFQDASVVLPDTNNGSRHDVEIPGALTTKVTNDIPAHLDSFRGQDATAGTAPQAWFTASIGPGTAPRNGYGHPGRRPLQEQRREACSNPP